MPDSTQYRSIQDLVVAVEWQLTGPRRSRLPRREWWVSGLCVLAALAFHGAMLAPVLTGTAAKAKRRPEIQGLGSAAVVGPAEMATTLTLISLSNPSPKEQKSLAEIASRGVVLPNLSLLIVSPSPDPLYDLGEDTQEADDVVERHYGTGERYAALFGRYMSQVTTRIERAWLRPRTEFGAKRFECEARIRQDRAGEVLSIELGNCNGDSRWQRSLVAAIQRSSPLSAPPEPQLFVPTLMLRFSAVPYVEGVSNESEYEPRGHFVEARHIAPAPIVANPNVALESIKDYAGAIELTIEGNRTTWKLQDKLPEEAFDYERESATQLEREPNID